MIFGVDVRLLLIGLGLVLATVAGDPFAVFDAFQRALGRGDIIGPICTAMGYAFVLKASGSDVAMVKMLTKPLRRFKWALIPGGVCIGFITNMAITSQTASAAALGPILVPVLLGAGYSPIAAAATLLVGCSVGGNLFNPGEPDVVAIQTSTLAPVSSVMGSMFTPNLISLVAATVVLMIVLRKVSVSFEMDSAQVDNTDMSYSLSKALLPPLPIIILLLLQPSLNLIPSLFERYPHGLYVSMVMLVCSALVMMVTKTMAVVDFFEGMGYAMAKVISLILAASCFIGGLTALGVVEHLAGALGSNQALAAVASPLLTWGLAVLGGSGTAPSVAFAQAMLPSISKFNVQGAVDIGVAGAIGASVGRTMSPVAAVVLFTSALANVPIHQIVRTVALPMLAALVSIVLYGLFS